MEKGGASSAIVKSIVLVVLGALVVFGLFMVLTRTKKNPSKDEDYQLTVVDEITTIELDKTYPASARKVVDLYAKTMKALYKEDYNSEQEAKMLAVLKGIMDQELLDNNLNFEATTKKEVKGRKEEDYSISNYNIQTREPEEVTVDGRKMCDVDCIFYLRHGSRGETYYYEFVMRREEGTGNWKILGWTLKDTE